MHKLATNWNKKVHLHKKCPIYITDKAREDLFLTIEK
jgi:hypothetical protein